MGAAFDCPQLEHYAARLVYCHASGEDWKSVCLEALDDPARTWGWVTRLSNAASRHVSRIAVDAFLARVS